MADNKQLATIGYIIIGLLTVNTLLLGSMYCKASKVCAGFSGQGKKAFCPYSGKGSAGSQSGSSKGSMAQ